MTSTTLVTFVFTSVALVGTAFFSAAETSLFSIPRERIFSFQKNPDKNYLKIYSLLKNAPQSLLMILLGNVFINITLTGLIHTLLINAFFIQSELITLAVATVVIVLFGEILPKNFALKHNEFIANLVAPLLLFLIHTFSPILKTIQGINSFFLYRLKLHLRDPGPFVTINELKTGLAKSVQNGAISKEEELIVNRILEHGPMPARKYMKHRSQLLIVEESASVDVVIQSMQREQHNLVLIKSKSQVFNISGMVRLFSLISASANAKIGQLSQLPVWAPETAEVAELIGYLLENNRSEVCLLDEYGGFSGLFSINEAINNIFMDLFQYQVEAPSIAKSVILRGSQEFESILSFLPPSMHGQVSQFRTVNGVLTNYLGRIPKIGDTFAIGDSKFYIISSCPTKIDVVLVQRGEVNDN